MDIVREIKDRVSMKELLDHYGIKPRRSTNNYTCLFHSPDEHPSAGITKDGKNFHCFSCNCTASVIDVVSQIKECDFKKALRIIDNDFKLGLYRALSQKEKLELARESRERERLKREKLYWANFEKIVLARIVFQLRKEEKVREICKGLKGKVNFDTRYDVYIDSEKRSAWLNWLYETICGYKDKQECEWDYTLGTEKMELLRAIKKGELMI